MIMLGNRRRSTKHDGQEPSEAESIEQVEEEFPF
jgi:hypothetical protein